MKMPDIIPEYLFAPCGMNCMVCYVHLKKKRACNGCLGTGDNKPERCKICIIKNCADGKKLKYCYECSEFPCKSIRNLDKSYRKRYAASLIDNSKYVKENGIVKFQVNERGKWTCRKCNGVVSLHDGICTECEEKRENYSKILDSDGQATGNAMDREYPLRIKD